MELESITGGLADIDIDAMFNSSTVDEFMHQISRRGTFDKDENKPKHESEKDAMAMLGDIMSGKKVAEDGSTRKKGEAPKLTFDEQEEIAKKLNESEHLRQAAMDNLRERRHRLK